jgi:hypothetical protein
MSTSTPSARWGNAEIIKEDNNGEKNESLFNLLVDHYKGELQTGNGCTGCPSPVALDCSAPVAELKPYSVTIRLTQQGSPLPDDLPPWPMLPWNHWLEKKDTQDVIQKAYYRHLHKIKQQIVQRHLCPAVAVEWLARNHAVLLTAIDLMGRFAAPSNQYTEQVHAMISAHLQPAAEQGA